MNNKDLLNGLLVFVALVALFLTLMGGCAAHRETQIIHVPTPIPCPVAPMVERPALAMALLATDATPDAVVKAAAMDIESLKGAFLRCEAVLDGYNKPLT